MSGSVPGTWTGTDTPGEMSPVNRERSNIGQKHVPFQTFKLWCYVQYEPVLFTKNYHILYICEEVIK